jgi:gamma-glutamyl-gamma-aminobutyrate hydrolase PuuD
MAQSPNGRHNPIRLQELERKLKMLEECVRTEKNANKLKQYENELSGTIEELRRARNVAQVELIKSALKQHKPA